MTNNNNNNNIIINHCHHHYYVQLPAPEDEQPVDLGQLPTELQATLKRLGPTAVEAFHRLVTTYRSQTLNASLMRQVLGLIVTLRRHMAAHVGVFRCCRQVLGIAPSTPYWSDFQLGDRFFRVDRDEMVVALCLDNEATLLPQDDFEPHRSPHLVAARCQLLALLCGLIRRNLRRSSASYGASFCTPAEDSILNFHNCRLCRCDCCYLGSLVAIVTGAHSSRRRKHALSLSHSSFLVLPIKSFNLANQLSQHPLLFYISPYLLFFPVPNKQKQCHRQLP